MKRPSQSGRKGETNPDKELAKEVREQTLEELSNRWTWMDGACEREKHLVAKRFQLHMWVQ